MTEEAWREELNALRRANDMVNDDCTLVVLCVGGAAEAGAQRAVTQPESLNGRAEAQTSPPNGGEEVATSPESGAAGEDVFAQDDAGDDAGASEQNNEDVFAQDDTGTSVSQHQGAEAPHAPKDFAIAADVGDLMIEVPHDPPEPENQGVDTPRSAEQPERHGPPPADEPPAARDGFSESTDPRV